MNATSTAKLTTRRKRSLAARVLALQEKGRAVFARKDDLFQALLQGCAIGEVIETERGAFIIQDNFANGRNVAFRPASVHRFELKEHRPIPLSKPKRSRGEKPLPEIAPSNTDAPNENPTASEPPASAEPSNSVIETETPTMQPGDS